MTINYFNESAVQTPGGLGTSVGSIVLQAATVAWAVGSGFLSMGRRRRHAQPGGAADGDQAMRDLVIKVLDDVDAPTCLPLALCHAVSLPRRSLTPGHHAIIGLLSPLPAAPVAWPAVHTPAAKYQYAAFVGQWAGITGDPEQCRRVFPACTMAPEDVITAVTTWKLPCIPNNDADNNIKA
ncbi:uncharacterized protein LOC126995808 [Eriocheir sinensis]|uniref:uncharacterized protein LOC126995808 n=1 Tax=Eriocheir sinensis TaxID=95602 RepID=UPI0021C8D490|nr:uncharacterized protein LOC126995808 [Eriocheir sinensis]